MVEETKAALFERTIVPHLDAAYNLARWITCNADDAEDMVQEAYLRALRYFDSFTGMDGRAWILSIVRNTCLTWYGKQKGGAVVFDERVHSSGWEQSTQETTMMQKDSAGALRGCIEALPVQYRETIILRELEEMSYKEIADVTALPVGTVMSRLSRARKRLEDCLIEKGARQ
jgi:RNA polymerase sigma-70 factor (ECF subfamily)